MFKSLWNSPKQVSQETIDELTERIEVLECVDREYLGDQKDSGNDVYMRISKDGSLNISTKSFKFIDMPKENALILRDFLVKNFPVSTKQTLTGDAALEFLKKDGESNGN